MRVDQPIPQLVDEITHLDRDHCIAELRAVPYLRLDFTEEFLRDQSLEGLQHILMAAVLQARRHSRAS